MPIRGRLRILGFVLAALMSLTSATTARASGPANICLFTDFGWDDAYVAQLKGVILTIDPGARLLDLTHSVAPYNITEGAYLLDQCAQEFPAGTIFVAVVDPGVGTDRNPILIETTKEKYFVGPDNGLFAQVIQSEGLLHAWKLDKPEFYRAGDVSRTFHGRDIFGPVAAHLAVGTSPGQLGTELKTLDVTAVLEPTYTGSVINTQVLHIDRYGNIILNLKSGSELAAMLKEGTLVKVSLGRDSFSAPFVKTYGDVAKGRRLLLFGSSGRLEISVNQGSAAQQVHVEPGTPIYLKP
jgi:S-adenosyl-L-methionine hydrolase (adenosine-forming)